MKMKKGFTLVEMILVIAIIVILSTIAIVGFTKYIDDANKESELVAKKNDLYGNVYSDIDNLLVKGNGSNRGGGSGNGGGAPVGGGGGGGDAALPANDESASVDPTEESEDVNAGEPSVGSGGSSGQVITPAPIPTSTPTPMPTAAPTPTAAPSGNGGSGSGSSSTPSNEPYVNEEGDLVVGQVKVRGGLVSSDGRGVTGVEVLPDGKSYRFNIQVSQWNKSTITITINENNEILVFDDPNTKWFFQQVTSQGTAFSDLYKDNGTSFTLTDSQKDYLDKSWGIAL